MSNKSLTLYIILSLLFLPGTVLAAGELSTLFTTPQERQLINANRYKSDEVKPQPVQDNHDEPDKSPIQRLALEEVNLEYQVSGISLASDGAYTVWINAIAYEDGALLTDWRSNFGNHGCNLIGFSSCDGREESNADWDTRDRLQSRDEEKSQQSGK